MDNYTLDELCARCEEIDWDAATLCECVDGDNDAHEDQYVEVLRCDVCLVPRLRELELDEVPDIFKLREAPDV
jgi:hypothetical protein